MSSGGATRETELAAVRLFVDDVDHGPASLVLDGLAGARVSFGGRTVHTNSHGKAIVKVATHAAKGKKSPTVSLTY